MKDVSVGLAHNFYRHKLKFSVDKVDVMVIQAVGLLDDLDKELNNYAMRLREWYGWHFPELGKILADNLTYAKVVNEIGIRTTAVNKSLQELVTDDFEKQIKEAAEISMGSEISKEDEFNIKELCIQIMALSEYRQSLTEYLKTRMMAIAPNLTIMVGELVAARLISHAGSLINLAKQPASTIQIFGAEKALFRALRTKHDTPKYGLIYHASLVGGAAPKLKGKISRSLASKCAICVRVDALSNILLILEDNSDGTVGIQHKANLEAKIKRLEKGLPAFIVNGDKKPNGNKIEKYSTNNIKQTGNYNPDTEIQLTKKKKQRNEEDEDAEDVVPVKKKKRTESN
jgi:nucleolar protein 58